METIILDNVQIENILFNLMNIRQQETDGLTQLKMRHIITDLKERYYDDYSEARQDIQRKYSEPVSEADSEVPEDDQFEVPMEEGMGSESRYFASEEDREAAEEEIVEIAEEEYEVELKYLIGKGDIKQLSLDGIGIDWLMPITEMEARRPSDNNEQESTEEKSDQ